MYIFCGQILLRQNMFPKFLRQFFSFSQIVIIVGDQDIVTLISIEQIFKFYTRLPRISLLCNCDHLFGTSNRCIRNICPFFVQMIECIVDPQDPVLFSRCLRMEAF